MLGMCLNWRVLAGLGAVAAGVALFAPGYALAILPLLLLAVCPLSMVAMMFAMKGMAGMGGRHNMDEARPAHPEALQNRLRELRTEGAVIERELAMAAPDASLEQHPTVPNPGARA
jgi:hypothetical protein